MIDYVQDRNGKVIWRADNRRCDKCNMAAMGRQADAALETAPASR